MKYINSIDPTQKRKKCLLVGKGSSIDKLDIKALNKQDEYDIFTIADSMKLFKNQKFSIHYHSLSILRCKEHLNQTQHLLVNTNIINQTKHRIPPKFKLEERPNSYFFLSQHRKMPQVINGDFDLKVNKRLSNHSGSIVGAINFMCGFMGYTDIAYTAFDGGEKKGNVEYGQSIIYARKESKKLGCIEKYFSSFKATKEMLKHYPKVNFYPLEDYLL